MRLRFDRGTLVLVGATPEETEGLPGIEWDPRVGVLRAPAYRRREVLEELARRRTPVVDEAAPEPAPKRAFFGPIELRPYQADALDAWDSAGRRGVVVLPTGGGKTRVALAAMERTGASTLCIVPTRVLLHQWRSEIARMREGPIGCFGDGEHRLAPITVATFESARLYMHDLGRRFELLVVDEAHHFGSSTRDEALEMSAAETRLGLTATPPEDAAQRARIEERLGSIVFQLEIVDLAGKYLAPFSSVTISVPLEGEERAAHEAARRESEPFMRAFRQAYPGASFKEMVFVASQSLEGRQALTAQRKARAIAAFTSGKRRVLATLLERHRERRVLVFTANNESAYRIAADHLVMPLTCHVSQRERERTLAQFRRGELRALVSARVLNEGLDVPDADVAIVVGGTQGTREYVQRVGRLLRPAPRKRAIVYELVSAGTSEALASFRRRMGLGGPRRAFDGAARKAG